MALTAPSSKLTAQAISASFDQLLYLDSAAGMVDTTLKIVSTETGHSALQITNDQVLILDKSGTDIASLFEVQDKDANIILSINGTNNRVGIGTVHPNTALEVLGSFAASGPSSTFVTMSSGDTSPDVSTGNIFKSPSLINFISFLFISRTIPPATESPIEAT